MAELVLLLGVLLSPGVDVGLDAVQVCERVGSEGVVAEVGLEGEVAEGWLSLGLVGVVEYVQVDQQVALDLLSAGGVLLGDQVAFGAGGSLLLVDAVDAALVLLQVRLVHLLADKFHSCVVVAYHEQSGL
jgi:hypothetical protein